MGSARVSNLPLSEPGGKTDRVDGAGPSKPALLLFRSTVHADGEPTVPLLPLAPLDVDNQPGCPQPACCASCLTGPQPAGKPPGPGTGTGFSTLGRFYPASCHVV